MLNERHHPASDRVRKLAPPRLTASTNGYLQKYVSQSRPNETGTGKGWKTGILTSDGAVAVQAIHWTLAR